jgi:hypothetical protein
VDIRADCDHDGRDNADASMGGQRRQEGKEMTLVSVTTACARRPGATAAVVAAVVSLAAAAPSISAQASSGSSHRSHSGDHHGSGSGSGSSPAPAPGGPTNLLTSADGTLHTAVGVYTDCTGASPLTTTSAAVDTCIGGRTYFVGHNPGVFTPLMHMGVGSLITWYDGRGVAHPYRVVAVRDATGGAQPLTTATRRVDAQFQTCAVSNGSVDRILDAVRA